MNIYQIFLLIFTILFYFLFILKIMLVMKQGVNPLALGKGKKGVHALLEYFFIVAFLFWTYQIFVVVLMLKQQILPNFLVLKCFNGKYFSIVGVGIMTLGMVLFVTALMNFKNSWRVGVDENNPGELITKGIFALSRNPIFLFIDLYVFGVFLLYPNVFFLMIALFSILGFHYQILQEEKFLEKHYGESYINYKKKTPRYFCIGK